MRQTLILAGLVAAAGCQGALRGWESAPLATHDREKAFEAAREVLGRHFEIAEANWTSGVIETRPAIYKGKAEGTLADLRGAGGRWRRTATCELARDGLTIVARMRVRTEREGTATAVEVASSTSDGRAMETPAAISRGEAPGMRRESDVWVDAGHDATMARELLGQIAERIRRMEDEETVPAGPSPKEVLEEGKRIGADQGL